MGKELYVINEFQVLKLKKGYMVRNLEGNYNKHTHLPKEQTCKLVIELVQKQAIPKKEYLIKSCIKITNDEKYIKSLNAALNKRHKKRTNHYRNYNMVQSF